MKPLSTGTLARQQKRNNVAKATTRPRAKKAAPGRPRTGPSGAGQPSSVPPPAGEGKRGESGYLGYLLRQAQAAARLTLERALSELGATVPQFVVLTMLKAYPGLSGAELARVALLTPQTVGVIIGNLERDGAIRKTPHPVHGRRLQWTLTPRGATLLDGCRKRALALERRLAADLTPTTERAVRQWLTRVAISLQQDG